MGSSDILRKPGRKNLYLRIFDTRTGREYRESANTPDERVARERLQEAERLVTLGAYVPPAERRRRSAREELSLHIATAEFLAKLINDQLSRAYVENTAYLLFNFLEFFEAADLRQLQAPHPLPACRLRRAKWKKTTDEEASRLLLQQPGDRPARLVSTELVEAYKFHRLTIACADATTVNGELKMLRLFGRWLRKRAHFPEDPFQDVGDVRDEDPSVARSLSVAEFGALALSAELSLQDWIVTTGLHGLRRGETDHLRPEDIDVENGFFAIRTQRDASGNVLWRPKFGKERRVPIVEAALPFARLLREHATDHLGRIFGVHDRRKAMARALEKSETVGHVRMHDLRHSAYTHLKSALLDRLDPAIALAEIRLIFGHADASMDRVYDHRTVDRLRRVISLTPLTLPILPLLESTR